MLTASDTIPESRKAVLHGYFTTALEGAIGYWSQCSDYHWMLPEDQAETDQWGYRPPDHNNFHAVLHPTEGGWGIFEGDLDTQPLTVDAAVMQRGAKLFMRYCLGEIDAYGEVLPADLQKPLSDDHYWRQWMVYDITGGSDGDFDADVADNIVQFGLFGKGVYG